MEEIIPKEDETIAVKRSNRLTERLLGRARERVFVPTGWWTSGLVEYTGLLIAIVLNVSLIAPQLGRLSINGSFSGPVIPSITQIVQVVSGVRLRYAMQLTEIFFFLLFPVTFYFFVRFLTKRKIIALLSVLLASLPVSLFAGSRILGGFYVDDVPHVASIGLVPLALLGLFLFLRRGKLINLLAAALLSSLILLTSPFGFLTYLVFAFFGTFSEMLLGYGRLKLLRFAVVFVVAAALVSFWYNPSFTLWLILGPFGKELRFVAAHLIPVSLFILPVAGTLGFLLFDRRPTLQPVFLATSCTIAFLLLVSASRIGTISPVASRFLPELGISLAFLLAVAGVLLFDWLSEHSPAIGRFGTQPVMLLMLVCLAGVILWPRSGFDIAEITPLRDSMEKGTLWLIRDNFDGPSLLSGYIITGAAVIGIAGVMLIFLQPKGKRQL